MSIWMRVIGCEMRQGDLTPIRCLASGFCRYVNKNIYIPELYPRYCAMCSIVWLRLNVAESRESVRNGPMRNNWDASEDLYTSLVYGDFAPIKSDRWFRIRIKIKHAPEQRSCLGVEVEGSVNGGWERIKPDDYRSYEIWTCARSYASGDATPYGGWFG